MLGEGTVLPTSLDTKSGGKSDGTKNKTDPRLKSIQTRNIGLSFSVIKSIYFKFRFGRSRPVRCPQGAII